MKKKEHFTPDYTKHYVLQEIGMIKGYKLVNETTETEGLIMNQIHIEINLASDTGHTFYEDIKAFYFTMKAFNLSRGFL